MKGIAVPRAPPPGRMNIITIASELSAIGRYMNTPEMLFSCSGRTGGSCRESSPSGGSGPGRRAGLRMRIVLISVSLLFPLVRWVRQGRRADRPW
ncbi:hypothetical protein GCM10007079_06470 [Nocardiopsis terrae]|nr:hypothetical protein GCM10007079_06470 [Nocardiopsis terrae]